MDLPILEDPLLFQEFYHYGLFKILSQSYRIIYQKRVLKDVNLFRIKKV